MSAAPADAKPVLTPAERAAVWREGSGKFAKHAQARAEQAIRLCAAGALTQAELIGAPGASQQATATANAAAKEG